MAPPEVTVITATWNRGRHIVPTVRSVLAQRDVEFEYLVIGDALDDDTETHLREIGDPRLRFVNLQRRSGTQSGPNNAGLDRARAPIAAYCGHDDIWAPDHLRNLVAAYSGNPDLDAVAAGLVSHGEWTKFPASIYGMFEDFTPFGPRIYTPPSAFSHRIDRGARLRWRLREDCDTPVDRDFQSRLAKAGYQFGSTRKITVHKWAAGHRYLDYLRLTAEPQQQMLDALLDGSFESTLPRLIARVRKAGRYMPDQARAAQPTSAAGIIQAADVKRGLDLPATVPLGRGVEIAQDDQTRAMDWFPAGKDWNGLRWCGPSTCPHVLLPVAASGPVEIECDMVALDPQGFPSMSITLNDVAVAHELTERFRLGRMIVARLTLGGSLRPVGPSILGFRLPDDLFEGDGPRARRGFAMGAIRIRPRQT